MKKYFNILSLLILFASAFLFLHSELDVFTPEHHLHPANDCCETFCSIINGAKTENNTIEISKILNIDLYNISINIPALVSTETFKAPINPQKIKTDIKFNILYNSFLI